MSRPNYKRPWIDWGTQEWLRAVYCPDCGLPLLKMEDTVQGAVGVYGNYQCVYCTWMEDERPIIYQDVMKEIKAGTFVKVPSIRDTEE